MSLEISSDSDVDLDMIDDQGVFRSMLKLSSMRTPSGSSSSTFFALDDGVDDDADSLSSLSDKDPFMVVQEQEAYCFDMKHFADRFVNVICNVAEEAASKTIPPPVPTSTDVVLPLLEELLTGLPLYGDETSDKSLRRQGGVRWDASVKPRPWSWPWTSEFSIKLGLEKISEYIRTWAVSKDWKFTIELLGFESEDCSNFFVYEVEWSIPTPLYPIPQVTASVYFSLEVYKMLPYPTDRPVGVTYIFEGSESVHRPGRTDFQERCLLRILHHKIKSFKTFTF